MKLEVFLPKNCTNHDKCVQRLQDYFLDFYDGFTVIQGFGQYKNKEHKIIGEHVEIFVCYIKNPFYFAREALTVTLLAIRELGSQDTIAYAIDNEISFL